MRSRTTPHSSVMRLDRQSATRLLLTTSAGRNSRRASSVDAAPHHGHRHSSVPSLAVTTHCSISTFLCARRHMALDLQVQPHPKRLTAFPPAATWLTAILHCLALMVPRGCRRSRVSHDHPRRVCRDPLTTCPLVCDVVGGANRLSRHEADAEEATRWVRSMGSTNRDRPLSALPGHPPRPHSKLAVPCLTRSSKRRTTGARRSRLMEHAAAGLYKMPSLGHALA